MAFNYSNYSGTGSAHLSNQEPMVEINTTPLVDVMLVLLVIFIITAPLFHQAVVIDLPKVDSAKLDEKPRIIQVALDAEGRVFIDNALVTTDGLGEQLQALLKSGLPTPEMHLRADRNTRYERIAEVMALAQKQGVTKIAFVTDPASAGKRN